ncbi:hypothetical protein ABH917_000050 [Thermobifida halotolerans]
MGWARPHSGPRCCRQPGRPPRCPRPRPWGTKPSRWRMLWPSATPRRPRGGTGATGRAATPPDRPEPPTRQRPSGCRRGRARPARPPAPVCAGHAPPGEPPARTSRGGAPKRGQRPVRRGDCPRPHPGRPLQQHGPPPSPHGQRAERPRSRPAAPRASASTRAPTGHRPHHHCGFLGHGPRKHGGRWWGAHHPTDCHRHRCGPQHRTGLRLRHARPPRHGPHAIRQPVPGPGSGPLTATGTSPAPHWHHPRQQHRGRGGAHQGHPAGPAHHPVGRTVRQRRVRRAGRHRTAARRVGGRAPPDSPRPPRRSPRLRRPGPTPRPPGTDPPQRSPPPTRPRPPTGRYSSHPAAPPRPPP